MINETFKIVGTLRLILTDKDGTIKLDRSENNIITTVGKTYIAQRIAASSTAPMSHIALGSSSSLAAAANTQLGSEFTNGRAVATPSNIANVARYTALFAAGVGTGAVTEAGIFNAAGLNSGIMLNRVTFTVINKDALDTLSIIWNITVA